MAHDSTIRYPQRITYPQIFVVNEEKEGHQYDSGLQVEGNDKCDRCTEIEWNQPLQYILTCNNLIINYSSPYPHGNKKMTFLLIRLCISLSTDTHRI